MPRRRENAAETRRGILAGARKLFIGSGYGATTIDAIARSAGVAAQTVYAGFGSKRGVLFALLGVAVPMPVNDDFLALARSNDHLAIDLMTDWALGERDLMTPARAGRKLAELCETATVTQIKGAGHMMMVEAPDAVLDALKNAL